MSAINASDNEHFVTPEYVLSDVERMNDLVGTTIRLRHTGRIFCIRCGKPIRKSYGQGYCYPCFTEAPETEPCVLRPELCRAHLGEARDMVYAKEHCLTTQVVYMAVSGGLKVGVTRAHQVPTRWVDQGASAAIVLATTPNRYSAGVVEVALKGRYADKTRWQAMLRGESGFSGDLVHEKHEALSVLSTLDVAWTPGSDDVFSIHYPVVKYPTKVKSVSLDKVPVIEGRLQGIRGQYLLFEGGAVFNVRAHTGYEIEFESQF